MNSRARGWSSVWLPLRSPLWTILLPGVFAGYVPWRFFGLVRTQFDLTSPTGLLGLVCIGLGVAVLSACIFEFARSGRARRSRRSTIRTSFAPQKAIWLEDKLPWVTLDKSLPSFPKSSKTPQ